VSGMVRISKRRYAVIAVRHEPHCERVVIAYPDEKTLCNLLGPSIVALGYSSREEAEASIYRYKIVARSSCRKPLATLVAKSMQTVKKFVSNHSPAKHELRFGKTQSTICGLLQHAFTAAAVVFYSKNVLSGAIRTLISF
jgi:hypothetical protein